MWEIAWADLSLITLNFGSSCQSKKNIICKTINLFTIVQKKHFDSVHSDKLNIFVILCSHSVLLIKIVHNKHLTTKVYICHML